MCDGYEPNQMPIPYSPSLYRDIEEVFNALTTITNWFFCEPAEYLTYSLIVSLEFVANHVAELTWEAYQPGLNDDRAALSAPVGALMYSMQISFPPLEVAQQWTQQMVEDPMDIDEDLMDVDTDVDTDVDEEMEDTEESSTDDADEGSLYEPDDGDVSSSSS